MPDVNPCALRDRRPYGIHHRWRAVVCGAALTALVAACGGGHDDGPVAVQPPIPANPAGRGELKASSPLGSIAPAAIADALALDKTQVQGVVPRYAVASWRLEYTTLDADGHEVRASGLISVPQKPAGSTSPVLSYQHGTIFHDAEAPSNHAAPNEVAVVLASLGYVVVAPDYVGFGVSRGTPHPYLLAAPTAAAVNDFLTAATYWRAANGVQDNGQLFLTGYSEGGYATMAAHRDLQASGSPQLAQLRMAVAGAGPYDVQTTLDSLIAVVSAKQPLLGALINPGFLRFLGSSVKSEVRRAVLSQLIPGDADVVYDTRFLDSFFADDSRAIAQDSSVYDWRPQVPVALFHGRDDQTVPYASSVNTLQAMQKRGAGDLVSLTDCQTTPAGHIPCVPPFVEFMLGRVGAVAQGL
jgi:dienelactone hydrolase